MVFSAAARPSRLPRTVGYVTVGLFCGLLAWATFGKLDVIAAAEGRLVPRNYSRVLQPAEAGIVREILVRDGDEVKAGQVLMRMDATTGELFVLEVNAQCGLSEDENYTSIGAILRLAGRSFSSMVRDIVADALSARTATVGQSTA